MKALNAGYAYIWEYTIDPTHRADFEAAYGPAGTWVQLFRRAPGYLRTELHHDRNDPLRYVTLDYWESFEAWQAFRTEFARDFEALDAAGETWTTHERELGRFTPSAGGAS